MKDNRVSRRSISWIISEKMQCLDDFGICDKNDKDMRKKLEEIVNKKPNDDPRKVLDYYCRPMIQAKVNSWQ